MSKKKRGSNVFTSLYRWVNSVTVTKNTKIEQIEELRNLTVPTSIRGAGILKGLLSSDALVHMDTHHDFNRVFKLEICGSKWKLFVTIRKTKKEVLSKSLFRQQIKEDFYKASSKKPKKPSTIYEKCKMSSDYGYIADGIQARCEEAANLTTNLGSQDVINDIYPIRNGSEKKKQKERERKQREKQKDDDDDIDLTIDCRDDLPDFSEKRIENVKNVATRTKRNEIIVSPEKDDRSYKRTREKEIPEAPKGKKQKQMELLEDIKKFKQTDDIDTIKKRMLRIKENDSTLNLEELKEYSHCKAFNRSHEIVEQLIKEEIDIKERKMLLDRINDEIKNKTESLLEKQEKFHMEFEKYKSVYKGCSGCDHYRALEKCSECGKQLCNNCKYDHECEL